MVPGDGPTVIADGPGRPGVTTSETLRLVMAEGLASVWDG
jgi:hypothetical protein